MIRQWLKAKAWALTMAAAVVALGCVPANAQMLAYVTNNGDSTVSVVDLSSYKVVATVPVGAGPIGVAVAPSGDFAYVANSGSNTISVIDLSQNTVTASVPVGSTPTEVAISPDGSVACVTNTGDNTVSIIDTFTNTVTGNVNVPGSPMGVAVGEDSNGNALCYVTRFAASAVAVIDASSNSIVASIPVGQAPNRITLTADGAYAYLTNQNSNSVSVIDTSTNSVVATVPVGMDPIGLAATPDSGFVYVANFADNTLSMISTNMPPQLIDIVQSAPAPVGVAVSPDGAYVLATSGRPCCFAPSILPSQLSVISTSSNTLLRVVQVGAGPVGVATTMRQVLTADSSAPRPALRRIRASLLGMLPSGNREIDDELDDELKEAIRHLNRALRDPLWVDDSHLTKKGEKVFNEERGAVEELLEVRSGIFAPIAVNVATVAGDQARIALQDALAAGDPLRNFTTAQTDLTKAQTDFTNAQSQLAQSLQLAVRGPSSLGNNLKTAIHYYRQAWQATRH